MRVWQQEGRYAEELLFASGFQRRWPIWEDVETINGKSRSVLHGRSRKVSRILPSRTSMVVTMKRKSLRMTAATRTTAMLRIRERMELRATTRKKNDGEGESDDGYDDVDAGKGDDGDEPHSMPSVAGN